MFWNEPNNLSHWDFQLDPKWIIFGDMVKAAANAVKAERRSITRVLGGISPIDPSFIENMQRQCVLHHVEAERIHWYSLYDLPRAWPATTRHREAEGSAYYRHFYMGLLREDGSAKPSLRQFQQYTPELGICQWMHFEDPRLDDAVRWLRDLGVKKLRRMTSRYACPPLIVA